MKREGLLGALLLVSAAAGCDGEIDARIGEALKGTASEVRLTDTHVEASCVGGEVAKVPIAELGLDFLGMADIEKQTAVAKQLSRQCEGFVREKAEEERQRAVFAAAGKELELELELEGKALEEQRALVCQALHARLPLRGPGREESIASHTRDYGCEDPGEPELGPARYWQVEQKGKGKQAAVYLRLASDPEGEAVDHLTVRCRGKRPEVYLTMKERVGKGPLAVDIDGKKGRWPTRSSKTGKALFLKDAKKGLRSLLGKERLKVRYPGKDAVTRSFDIGGVEAALGPHRRRCRI